MRKWEKILLAGQIAAMWGGISVYAAPMQVATLPEVVVTATRTENTIQNVPASTQIITQKDIQRSGSNDLRGLISHETGIFQKYRSRGGGHDVIIRGMDTDKTLILIDGRRVANEADATGLGNAMAFDRISLSDIERIEIVKGPSSALYGSEAMGGVVNVITKQSGKPSGLAGVSRSKRDANNWYHFDTGRKGNLSAAADMKFNKIFRKQDADDAFSDSYGTAEAYNFSAKYHIKDNQYVQIFYDYFTQHLKSDTGVPQYAPLSVFMGRMQLNGSASIEGVNLHDYKQKNYGVSLNGHSSSNDWQIRLYRSVFDWNDQKNQKVSGVIPDKKLNPGLKRAYMTLVNRNHNTHDFNENSNALWALEGKNTWTVNSHNRLTFGAEYIDNTVKGTNLGSNGTSVKDLSKNGKTKKSSEVNIDTYAFYVQDEIENGKWFIVPAFRYDHHSTFGGHVSPKLGLTYKAQDNLRFKFNYGDGFKAPSVYQLYYSLYRMMGQTYVNLLGNKDLKPEESKSFDVGVEAEFGNGYGSLSYFDSHVKNLIESEKIGNDGRADQYRYMNVGKARIKGVESILGYKWNDRWEIRMISNWLSAKNTTDNLDLVRRPRFSQIYQLIYDDHKDTGYSAVLWDQWDYQYVTEHQEKTNYNLLNFTLTRRFNKNTRLYGTVENILDKKDSKSDLDGRFWIFGFEHAF